MPNINAVEVRVEVALLSFSYCCEDSRADQQLTWEDRATVPQYTLQMPITGNAWAVGVLFLIHITVVAFVIGIAMVAPVAELVGMRQGREWWEQLAHKAAADVEHIFAWGATFAAFGLVAIWGLYPRLWGYLVSLFFFQIIIIAGLLWFVMTATAYLYYLTWERLRRHKIWHNLIGWTFVLFTMLFINTITNLSSYQLTPAGGRDSLLAAAVNPSYIAEFPHRHIGNLSYGTILLAAYTGGWFLLFRGKPVVERERAFRDWLQDTLLLIGLSVTVLQPISGWFYVSQILRASPGAWARMMPGPNGWMFQIQIGLVGAVFFLGSLYMHFGLRRGEPGRWSQRWMKCSLWVLPLFIGLAVLPHSVPLGTMRPWKYLALAGYILTTVINLVLYFRARRSFVWAEARPRSQMTLAALGVVLVALFAIMGVIRESARGTDPIYNIMPSEQSQEILRP